jgi:hypothetical protein
MPFDFTCPSCDNITEAQDEWNGMEAECPHCGDNVTIKRKLTVNRPAVKNTAPSPQEQANYHPIPKAPAKNVSPDNLVADLAIGLHWAKLFIKIFIFILLCIGGFLIYSYVSAWKMRSQLTDDLINGEDKKILLRDAKELASKGWGDDEFRYKQLKASFLVKDSGCYQIKDGKAVPIEGVEFKVTKCAWGTSPNTVKIDTVFPSNIWISLLIINKKLMPFKIERDYFIYRTDSNSCQWGQAISKKNAKKFVELGRAEGLKISLSIGFSHSPPRTLEFNNGEYVFRAAILEHYLIDDFKRTAFGKPGGKGAKIFPMYQPLEQCFISPEEFKKAKNDVWNYPTLLKKGPRPIPAP